MTLIITSCSEDIKNSYIDVVGTWQFPERQVWIQLNSDGQAFQCRIDMNGSVISSRGELHRDNTIRWQRVWEPDRIRRDGDTIYLKGTYGDFGFDKTNSKMIYECQNPIP